ncbi:MAG TPA: hypothetical protein VGN86_10315 [Pyrinomonadaceae bacterium]|jgi:hypothetical protein|nr:hypothetical protein [Pyrinomonadaceae bacterium]
MFCPKCGSTQNDELKFCKSCGANLFAVRQVVDTRETSEGFDWSKTWVAEMFMSPQELKRRKEQIERQRGITPEMKRYNEIKAGVICGSVGIAVAIFLFVFMQGIIQSGNVTPNAAEILSRIWIAGVLPLFVGIALVINGVFVSRKLLELTKRESQNSANNLEEQPTPRSLEPADTNEFVTPGFSVTDQTTKHLRSSDQKR